MQRLFLTAIKRVLNEDAQKRLDAFDDEDYDEEPRDEHGRTAEFYTDLNLPIPESLKNKQSDFIKFDLEKDYDTYEIDVIVNMNDFVMVVDDEEFGSTVYLSNGNNIQILEDSADINAQIWWNTRSRWQRFKDWVEGIYNIIKKKISTTNK